MLKVQFQNVMNSAVAFRVLEQSKEWFSLTDGTATVVSIGFPCIDVELSKILPIITFKNLWIQGL